jgi:hypothetical protein
LLDEILQLAGMAPPCEGDYVLTRILILRELQLNCRGNLQNLALWEILSDNVPPKFYVAKKPKRVGKFLKCVMAITFLQAALLA